MHPVQFTGDVSGLGVLYELHHFFLDKDIYTKTGALHYISQEAMLQYILLCNVVEEQKNGIAEFIVYQLDNSTDPTVLRLWKKHRSELVDQISQTFTEYTDRAPGQRQQPSAHAAPGLPRMMPQANMPYFMCQHARQILFIIHCRQQASGNINIAPGSRECIGLELVNDGKTKGIGCSTRTLDQALTHRIYVGGQFGVIVQSNLVLHLVGHFVAVLTLHLWRDY